MHVYNQLTEPFCFVSAILINARKQLKPFNYENKNIWSCNYS